MRAAFALVFYFASSATGLAQDASWQYFISVNTNVYLPRGGLKQVYPIIGYNRDSDPRLLIGGFGIGVSASRLLSRRLAFSTHTTYSKHTYWDEAFELRGTNNEPLGDLVSGSSDFALGISAMMHVLLSETYSLGAGISAQLLTFTLSRISAFSKGKVESNVVAMNRHYKPVLPMIPFEISRTGEKMRYSIRYQHGLSNRYRKPLSAYREEQFSLLYFEVAFRIR